MTKPCPVTGKPIPRRYAVHSSVFAAEDKAGNVQRNNTPGTLRRYVYVPAGRRQGR